MLKLSFLAAGYAAACQRTLRRNEQSARCSVAGGTGPTVYSSGCCEQYRPVDFAQQRAGLLFSPGRIHRAVGRWLAALRTPWLEVLSGLFHRGAAGLCLRFLLSSCCCHWQQAELSTRIWLSCSPTAWPRSDVPRRRRDCRPRLQQAASVIKARGQTMAAGNVRIRGRTAQPDRLATQWRLCRQMGIAATLVQRASKLALGLIALLRSAPWPARLTCSAWWPSPLTVRSDPSATN